MDASKPGFSVLRRRTGRAAGKAGLHRPETKDGRENSLPSFLLNEAFRTGA